MENGRPVNGSKLLYSVLMAMLSKILNFHLIEEQLLELRLRVHRSAAVGQSPVLADNACTVCPRTRNPPASRTIARKLAPMTR